ncbi:MAG: hypothetical protein IPP44_12485 [Ideonella sp.]|nr:hypothetical protein [Ideonella sp.]
MLALLRSFHKAFLPPERHVQELRFPFASTWNLVAQHSIQAFTRQLQAAAAPASAAASRRPGMRAQMPAAPRGCRPAQQSCRAAVGADAFNVARAEQGKACARVGGAGPPDHFKSCPSRCRRCTSSTRRRITSAGRWARACATSAAV